MRTKAALAIYLIIGTVNVVLGGLYFTSEQFMSHHSQAVGAPWREVDPGAQALILALMKMAGGGWIVLGFFTIILALAEFVRSSIVSRWALPTGTLIFYLASLSATWGVYQETGASDAVGPVTRDDWIGAARAVYRRSLVFARSRGRITQMSENTSQ